jgi:hypothetical protein
MSFFYETAKFNGGNDTKQLKKEQTMDDALKSGTVTSRQSAIIDKNINKNEQELRVALQSSIAKYEKFDDQQKARGKSIADAIKKTGRKMTSAEESQLRRIHEQRQMARSRIDRYKDQLWNIECAQMARGDIEIANKQAKLTAAQSQFMKKSSLTMGSASIDDMASIQINTQIVRQSAASMADFHDDQTRDHIDNARDEQQQRSSRNGDVDIESILDEFSCDTDTVRLNNSNNYTMATYNNGATAAEDKLLQAFDQL